MTDLVVMLRMVSVMTKLARPIRQSACFWSIADLL
jgi:hypothetical protein